MDLDEAREILEDMKKKIQEDCSKRDQLKGQREQLLKRLKEYGCSSPEAAEQEVKKLSNKFDFKKNELLTKVDGLIEEMNWE